MWRILNVKEKNMQQISRFFCVSFRTVSFDPQHSQFVCVFDWAVRRETALAAAAGKTNYLLFELIRQQRVLLHVRTSCTYVPTYVPTYVRAKMLDKMNWWGCQCIFYPDFRTNASNFCYSIFRLFHRCNELEIIAGEDPSETPVSLFKMSRLRVAHLQSLRHALLVSQPHHGSACPLSAAAAATSRRSRSTSRISGSAASTTNTNSSTARFSTFSVACSSNKDGGGNLLI